MLPPAVTGISAYAYDLSYVTINCIPVRLHLLHPDTSSSFLIISLLSTSANLFLKRTEVELMLP
jgi:hypothetical protein